MSLEDVFLIILSRSKRGLWLLLIVAGFCLQLTSELMALTTSCSLMMSWLGTFFWRAVLLMWCLLELDTMVVLLICFEMVLI